MTDEKNTPKYYRRFSTLTIVEHLIATIVFFSLVATGLPQRFHHHEWSGVAVSSMGGIARMRYLHRLFGFLFAFQFAFHILFAVLRIWALKKIPKIVPRLKDVKDMIQSFQHGLYLTDEQPRYGRYEWKQKFEYWGLVVGGSLMITTGLILWFPIIVATYFSAEFIPIARVAHSSEAFLAFMVIFFWHLYSVILSPDVFPLDTSIFTGKISEKRLKHHHPLEFEEMKKSDTVPK